MEQCTGAQTQWGYRKRWLMLGAGVCAAASPRAHAAEFEVATQSIAVHGFVSQGFLLTTNDNRYLSKRSDRGSFEFSEVGLNFTSEVAEGLRVGVQLFARELGPVGNYEVRPDWYFLDYRLHNLFGIRAGRVKMPFGLFNDSVDIDAARVAVLPPQSVYPVQNRDFLLAVTGGELYGYADLNGFGALDYRLYGGTIFLDVDPQPGAPLQVQELTVPYVIGGRLMWEPPVVGWRLGGSVQRLRLDTTLLATAPTPAVIDVGIPATLWVASTEFTKDQWHVAAEYSRWHVSVESSDTTVYPEQSVTSERAYVMLDYRVTDWFQPGGYYSLLFPTVERRDHREYFQHDIALTVRFDINPYWLVKGEGHFMHGTAALNSALNDGQRQADLAANWALFLVKTTASF